MRAVALPIFLGLVVLSACAPMTVTTPMPSALNITPPPAGLPPKLAAFSGVWEGTSDAGYDVRLIVEAISENQATVVYALGDHPRGIFKGRWVRVTARVVDNGNAIEWEEGGGIGKRHYVMDRSLNSIHGRMSWGDLRASVTLRRPK